MGNATKALTYAPQPVHNAIAKRLREIHNEAGVHQRVMNRIASKLNSGSYNERDIVRYEQSNRRIKELIREKNGLERMKARFY
jgi:sugar-specific transcriptional regulator TrmB